MTAELTEMDAEGPRGGGKTPYALALGARLREAREAAGMSLVEVQRASRGRWPAVVVGSWERADRRISPEKLIEIAALYGADPAELLTGRPAGSVAPADILRGALVRLARLPDSELRKIARPLS